jgi:hypothetical protein
VNSLSHMFPRGRILFDGDGKEQLVCRYGTIQKPDCCSLRIVADLSVRWQLRGMAREVAVGVFDAPLSDLMRVVGLCLRNPKQNKNR